MADLEHLTVTLPADLADAMPGAVESGDYGSLGDVVREALQDWSLKQGLRRIPARSFGIILKSWA